MRKTTAIEAGDKYLQIIKTASYGMGMTSKQLVRAAVDAYIKQKYDIDVSMIEKDLSATVKHGNISEATKMLEVLACQK